MSAPRIPRDQAERAGELVVHALERATERAAKAVDRLRASSPENQVERAERPEKEVSTRRGLGRVYKRGNVWWVGYSYRGKKYRESSGSANRADAVRLLKRRLAEIGRGRLIGPSAEKTTFGELVELIEADYRVNGRRSLDRVQLSIRHLRDTFPDRTRVADVTVDRIRGYVDWRLAEGASNGTVNRELTTLKRMLRLGAEAGKVAFVPKIQMLREDNVRKGFVSRGRFEAILQHLPEHLHALFVAAFTTGWRLRSELLTREWRHVDLEHGWLILEPGEGKTGEGRQFPLTPKLRAALERQYERKHEIERTREVVIRHVFFYDDGSPVRDVRRAWEKACEEAGMPGLLVHDLRRSAAREMIRSSIPQIVAQRLIGHRTASIFTRYCITDEDLLRDAVDKLAVQEARPIQAAARQVVPLERAIGSRS